MSHENIVDNSTTTVKTDESSTIDVRSYAQGAAKRNGRTPDYGNFPVGIAKKNFPLARFARQLQRWRIRFSCFIHQRKTREWLVAPLHCHQQNKSIFFVACFHLTTAPTTPTNNCYTQAIAVLIHSTNKKPQHKKFQDPHKCTVYCLCVYMHALSRHSSIRPSTIFN